MPNKKLLIGGGIAILLALTAYIITTPKDKPTAPVSREEFSQDMEGLDFETLQGKEREQAISHLRDMAANLSGGRGPRGGRGPDRGRGPGGERSGQRSGTGNPMDKLQPEERRQIMGPMFQRFREEREKQMEEFFEKGAEEQAAEIDQIVDRMERMEERRQERAASGNRTDPQRPREQATGGNRTDPERPRQQATGGTQAGQQRDSGRGPGRGWGRNRSPDARKERSLARLQRSDSAHRAKRQEFMRRVAARAGQRKQAAQRGGARAAAKREAERKRAEEERKKWKPVTEEILVEKTVRDGLLKLTIGEPVTIANVAKEGEAPEIIVARAGKRLGELPIAKQAEYADYMTARHRIWAKVLELDPASDRLLIEVKVE